MTEQGTFYRRERIGENIKSAFLDAQNIDLYDNGRQNFDIGDDGFTNAALFNFKFTDPQPFGGGKLVGAEADLYLNSLNDGPSGLTATGVKVYKSNNLIETEGGLTNTSCLGLAGNKIYTNTAYQGYYQADISESFTDCVFGQMETDTFVSKTQIGKDPYLPFNIALQDFTPVSPPFLTSHIYPVFISWVGSPSWCWASRSNFLLFCFKFIRYSFY